jgi:hypothetical protein
MAIVDLLRPMKALITRFPPIRTQSKPSVEVLFALAKEEKYY